MICKVRKTCNLKTNKLSAWAQIAKKFNHQGLQMLSISFMGLLGVFSGSEESLHECALCILC
ncbi:DUF3693 domain-containing protein [Aliivibrio wodanis]|uniref:DUF3693 domain-containing protein n=1 Tax=Aliivibrio wodanis TaxID=80852 RepID=UPI00406D28A7